MQPPLFAPGRRGKERRLYSQVNPIVTLVFLAIRSGTHWLLKHHLISIQCSDLNVFFLSGTVRSGWYPRPGFESSNSYRNAPLKNAVVNCSGEPPIEPAECREKPCLFNIEDDPCEYYNVAEIYPDVLEKLVSVLENYKKTMVAPRNKPIDKAADPNAHGGVWTPWRD